jgi:predicted nucleic acid-binding protein
MTTDAHTIVVTDANVLINLMHVTRLDMCARLPGYEFVIPDHVREEITDATQRPVVDDAVARGAFRLETITGLTTVGKRPASTLLTPDG